MWGMRGVYASREKRPSLRHGYGGGQPSVVYSSLLNKVWDVSVSRSNASSLCVPSLLHTD